MSILSLNLFFFEPGMLFAGIFYPGQSLVISDEGLSSPLYNRPNLQETTEKGATWFVDVFILGQILQFLQLSGDSRISPRPITLFLFFFLFSHPFGESVRLGFFQYSK